MLKHRQYIYFYVFSLATLNEAFTAYYDGVLPRTPYVRPKSEIYTPKREDEHPHPLYNDKKYYFMILKDNIVIKLQELITEV